MRPHRLIGCCCTAALAILSLAGCDDLDSKARAANEKHEQARQEVKTALLPGAAKALPSIAPITIDVRVDESGKITKCLSNRAELPGCVGTVLKNGESSAYSFSMDEVAELRSGVKPLKDSADAPAK